jgi:hypothetical protein
VSRRAARHGGGRPHFLHGAAADLESEPPRRCRRFAALTQRIALTLLAQAEWSCWKSHTRLRERQGPSNEVSAMNRIQPLALGIAIGVLAAVYIAFLAIAAMNDWGVELIAPIASVYIGYEASVPGALIGAAWALVDGFIAGVVIAWIYNLVAKH